MNLKFNSGPTKRVFNHLRLLGLPDTLIREFVHQTIIWEQNSGTEWTVNRLKSLKTAIVSSLAAGVYTPPAWFRHDRQGRPKGVFKHLWPKLDANPKQVRKAISALMVYTAYKSSTVTQKQYIKTIGSIESSDTLDLTKTTYLSDLGQKIGSKYVGKTSYSWKFHPAGLNTGKPGVWSELKYVSSFIQGLNVPKVASYLESVDKSFNAALAFDLPLGWDDRQFASPGMINIIQERGFKPRVVAMPHASVQIALYPLHQHLNSLLMELPTDCTHNQESGALFAQDALKAGRTVYSVDLSGATDNFPKSLQIGILKGIGLSRDAEFIQHLCSLEWKLSPALREFESKEYVTYTKGQPQGMYSSFPLFGLSHNILLYHICDLAGVEPVESFRILGDDIVITNSEVHDKYRQFLQTFKVPISEDKSLQSDSYAEFAGYLITPDALMKPAKVPDGNVENSFINYLKTVGYNGLNSLPGRLRGVARKVAELPEDLGGLGFNPHGKSYRERVESLVKTSSEAQVPKYLSLMPELLAKRYECNTAGELQVVEWLTDQVSAYERTIRLALEESPLPIASISTEPHALAYQLSLVPWTYSDVQDGLNQAFKGNKSKDDVQPSFKTEFSQWRDKVTLDSSYFVDRYHKDLKTQIDTEWTDRKSVV